MKLIDFINKHYNGVAAWFGHDNGYPRQHVRVMLKHGKYYVVEVNGQLELVILKRQLNPAKKPEYYND